ncbi:MAG: hypothetical protein GX063_03385 [Firmicutes bacterium]|nr:hypothetical protein [Bacillota bacterium]
MLLRQRAVRIVSFTAVVLGLFLLLTFLWTGYSIKDRNPLAALTHQRAEELLSQVLNQPVKIGKVSFLSFNRLLLENVTSVGQSSGRQLEDGEPERQDPGQGLSFRAPRIIVGFNPWRYLRDGEVNFITVQVYQPHLEVHGSFLPLSAGTDKKAKDQAEDLGPSPGGQVEVIINAGRLTYSGTRSREPLVLEAVSGTVFFGSEGGGAKRSKVEIDSLEFSSGSHRLELQGEIALGKGAGSETSINLFLTTKDKGRLSLTGQIHGGGAGQLDLSVAAERLTLTELFSLAHLELIDSGAGFSFDIDSLDGLIDGRWRVKGQWDKARWQGEFRLSQVSYGNISLGWLEGLMTFEGRNLRAYNLQGSILGSSITGQGMAAVGPEMDYDVHLTISRIKPAEAAMLTKVWELKLPAAASRVLEDLEAKIHLHPGEDGSQFQADWQAAWQGEVVLGTVSFSPDGTYRASARLEIGSLADFAQHFPWSYRGRTLTGKLSAAANIRGVLGQEPESGIEVHLQELVLDSYSLGEGDIYGTYQKNRLVVTRGKWETSFAAATIQGGYFDPSTGSFGVELELTDGEAGQLAGAFGWEADEPLDGIVQGNVRLFGRIGDLQGEGTFALTGGRLGAIAFSGKAHVALRDKELQVSSLVLEQAGGGVITGEGTVSLENFHHPVLDLTGEVSELTYSSGPFAGKLSGDISLAGIWPQPLFSGRLSLQQGSFDLGKLGQTGTLAFELPLAVDVEIDDSLKVTGIGMLDLTAVGGLHIGGSTKAPILRGRIEAERGQVVYLGTPFKVVKGWADFRPYQGLIPDVYLEGLGEVKGTPVTLILQGPGDNMEPSLRSEEGFSQDELLSMLGIPAAVNMVLDDGLGKAIQREMGRLLGGQLELHVLGNLERHLQAALGLDELKLEPGLSDGRVGLELGKYISDGIFLAYTQTVYPHWENRWHVDYRLSDKMRVSTSWDGDGEYRLGLEMRIAF